MIPTGISQLIRINANLIKFNLVATAAFPVTCGGIMWIKKLYHAMLNWWDPKIPDMPCYNCGRDLAYKIEGDELFVGKYVREQLNQFGIKCGKCQAKSVYQYYLDPDDMSIAVEQILPSYTKVRTMLDDPKVFTDDTIYYIYSDLEQEIWNQLMESGKAYSAGRIEFSSKIKEWYQWDAGDKFISETYWKIKNRHI